MIIKSGTTLSYSPRKNTLITVWLIGLLCATSLMQTSCDLLSKESYPKNRREFEEAYLDKFWKYTSIDVQEIYVNGVKSEDRKKTFNDIVSEDLNATDYTDFFVLEKMKGKDEYWIYEESTDSDIKERTYETSWVELSTLGKNFVLTKSTEKATTYKVENDEIVEDNIETLKNVSRITSISGSRVKGEIDMVIKIDEEEIRLIGKFTCEEFQPPSISKFKSQFDIAKIFNL